MLPQYLNRKKDIILKKENQSTKTEKIQEVQVKKRPSIVVLRPPTPVDKSKKITRKKKVHDKTQKKQN